MATIKGQVQSDLDRTFPDAVEAAEDLMLASFRQPDVAEGVHSYLERRPPAFPSLEPRS
jgi:enoyl-CoA hydratase/carnithine racemase